MVDVLVVEDNEELGGLICDFLIANGLSLYHATSGEDALTYFIANKAKVVLLDLMLPGIDGYEVCDEIRHHENVPILIMSAKNQKDDKMLGFDLGADDYIEKPFDIDILIAKLQACLRRSTVTEEHRLIDGNLILDIDSFTAAIDDKQLNLSSKEFELLHLFLSNPNKTLRKDWIFNQVWGMESFSEPSTLTVHINKLREKIEENPKKPKRILTVWGVGYKYESIS